MKRFGATLEHDQASADRHLRKYAARHDIAIDTRPPVGIGRELEQAQEELQNLQVVGGAAFDYELAETMVEDHQRAIQIVERAGDQVADPELRAIPVITAGLLDVLDPSRTPVGDEPR